jgi:hypothetical protein
MPRRMFRSGLTVLVALIALLGGASVVRAEPLWVYATCANGQLASAEDGGQDNVVVFGSSAFCLLHVLDSKFGVAVFEAGMTTTNVLSYNLRLYNLVGSRNFGMQVAKGRSGTFGVCLVASPTKKIACAKIIFDHNSGYVEFTTISPTDSLVNARITGAQIAVDPRCGACF